MTGPDDQRFGPQHWTVVTVTYNSAEQLQSCWAAGDRGDARWLVIDNASTDSSVAIAEELGAKVIRLPNNVGFSAANNVGLARVETEWVAFANPDITVRSGVDFERLAQVASANQGFVAPQLLNPDGTEQPNARGLPYPLSKLGNRSIRVPGVDPADYARTGLNQPTYVAWVMGAALAGRTDDFRAIDGWDERFFIYYEDHDIGLRAWDSGRPVVLDPAVRWVHGWQRETTQLRLMPWLHEVRSGTAFYRKYPALLSRKRAGKSPAFAEILRRLWLPAVSD